MLTPKQCKLSLLEHTLVLSFYRRVETTAECQGLSLCAHKTIQDIKMVSHNCQGGWELQTEKVIIIKQSTIVLMGLCMVSIWHFRKLVASIKAVIYAHRFFSSLAYCSN